MRSFRQFTIIFTSLTILCLFLSLNNLSIAAICGARCANSDPVQCSGGVSCVAFDNGGCISFDSNGWPVEVKFCNQQQ